MAKTLADIGRIAVELHAARLATNHAKALYYEQCSEYFEGSDQWNRDDPEFHQATKVPYEAFRKARAHEYNAKRRLANAIRTQPRWIREL